MVKRSPYESDPATWPVLGEDCAWQQQKPAYSVLATLTRSFELPAEQGKGPVRLGAVVTVHRTREDAAWEMAESLEESMRCPTQQLREGEQIGSMIAGALLVGEGMQATSEDSLSELGQYRSSELGGPHHYFWQQAQTLQFTVAVTGKGAKGAPSGRSTTSSSMRRAPCWPGWTPPSRSRAEAGRWMTCDPPTPPGSAATGSSAASGRAAWVSSTSDAPTPERSPRSR